MQVWPICAFCHSNSTRVLILEAKLKITCYLIGLLVFICMYLDWIIILDISLQEQIYRIQGGMVPPLLG